MEKTLLRINAGTVFGLTRNCITLATSTPLKRSKFIESYEKRFNKEWRDEWIVAMHQHWVMVDMKTSLGKENAHDRDRLSNMRTEYVGITADSFFPQVTSDPTGAELYNRWSYLLNIEDLNKSVSSQIEALDDNARRAFERKFNLFTYLFIPISILASLSVIADHIDHTDIMGLLPYEPWLFVGMLLISLVPIGALAWQIWSEGKRKNNQPVERK
jgi:hypothetical protein